MAEFKLPKLRTLDKIVDALGRPSIAFVNFFGQFSRAIETQERTQDEILQEIIELNDVQDMLIDDLTEAQEDLVDQQNQINAQVAQIQALLGLTQSAQQAANDAQTTADDALGTGSVSGSSTNPSVDLTVNGAWITGPIVNLASVVAGNLTIAGSGPIQDEDVNISGGSTASCEFRIMQVIGGVDTLKFTGTFTVDAGAFPATVINLSSAAVSAYSSAEASTGTVSYRIDARKVSGAVVTDLALYVYARRAA